MYRNTMNQKSLFDDPLAFGGAKLNPDNRWIKLSRIIPWEVIEEKYSKSFKNPKRGNPAKPARMALGSHIIKEKFGLSDAETVEMIRENPYMQYFIGMPSYSDKPPFDETTMTWFRKRLSPEMIEEVNNYITGRSSSDTDNNDKDDKPTGSPPKSDGGQTNNKGTLILDATCVPSDIRFPTDASLLNEAREKLESIIDTLYANNAWEKKPRTYRRVAHKDYMRFARNRRPGKKVIRKAIKRQLGYIERDLRAIAAVDTSGLLSAKEQEHLAIIQRLYQQQKEMFTNNRHRADNRIVSISQPWVRPIVRGKTAAPVEFGAKVSISMNAGYAYIESLSWDAYNESQTLKDTVERYYQATGSYPDRILADKIYRTRDNLSYCKKHGIHMNGPKLGRPTKDKELYAQQCRQEKMESGERNAVEGEFGTGKRNYGLNRLTARLKETSETQIHLIFMVMNLWKRLRLLPSLFLNFLFYLLNRNVLVFSIDV